MKVDENGERERKQIKWIKILFSPSDDESQRQLNISSQMNNHNSEDLLKWTPREKEQISSQSLAKKGNDSNYRTKIDHSNDKWGLMTRA